MKKIFSVIVGLFIVSNVFGLDSAFDKNLQNAIKQEVKIIKVESLKSSDSVVFVLVEPKGGNGAIFPLFASKDGKIAFGASNVLFVTNDDDKEKIANTLKQIQASKRPSDANLSSFFKKIHKDEYIIIKSKNAKKITYIVSDPNCPSCQKELKSLTSRLSDSDVYMLLVGFVGADSAIKSAMIKDRLLGIDDNDKKINLLNEVYTSGYKVPSKYANIDIKNIMQINQKVVDAGIQSVPFIFESSK